MAKEYSSMTRFTFIVLSLTATLLCAGIDSLSAQTLTVGSKAPALDIEHWVSDGRGEFPHTTELKRGQIYVVEFWATWCGPCLRAMPHLAELQEKYQDKVQFISVTDEPLEEVSALMGETYFGSGKTFGELTSVYSLTADPDGSTHRQYMDASGYGNIPVAFVIGTTGEIELIDSPMAIGGVLEKLVDGSWDRQAFYAAKKKKENLLAEIAGAIDAEDIQKAFRLSLQLDELTDPSQLMQTNFMQTQLAINVGDQQAQQFFIDTAKKYNDQDGAVAAMVWMVVQMKYEGEEPSKGILQAAEQTLTQHIDELETPNADRQMMKGAVMDILSHLYYVQNRLDDAIANQEAAVKFNNDAELTDFLKKMKQEKANQ